MGYARMGRWMLLLRCSRRWRREHVDRTLLHIMPSYMGFAKKGLVKEAVDLFMKMVEKDIITYTTIINGLCKTGNATLALEMLKAMEKGTCRPDSVIYNTIINGLCKKGLVKEAVDLFMKMVEKDIIAYGTIINGLCKTGNATLALEMLKAMEHVDRTLLYITLSYMGFAKRGW
eukprot:TRINITY_DN18388_c0_g1_i2.p1 TRINITY_DN18388_c0_g1~~TRINITY_DN18388_c0_g1_i2.p1  ORF type:complete len:174 (-),score=27.41 TRINITY_DN18388_c0_g1_i2:40-561(-)